MKIRIKRQAAPNEVPYWSCIEYHGDGNISVADWLADVNATVLDFNRIAIECSCLEGRCGACALRVNSRPALACRVKLRDAVKNNEIILEPLKKFPVLKDLVVDRSQMHRQMLELKLWPRGMAECAQDLRIEASMCLLCGCCLDTCPRYGTGTFPGPAAIVQAYASGKPLSAVTISTCLRDFSCMHVCPAGIPIKKFIDLI